MKTVTLKVIANGKEIEVTTWPVSNTGRVAAALIRRGIDADFIKSAFLGIVFGRLCLVMPVFAAGTGKIIAIKTRSAGLSHDASYTLGSPKGGVMACPEGLDALNGRWSGKDLIICEGEIDLFSLESAFAHDNDTSPAIWSIFSGAWSPGLAAMIPAHVHVYLMTDLDEAGDRYASKVAQSLPLSQKIFRLVGEEGSDINDLLMCRRLDPRDWRDLCVSYTPPCVYPLQPAPPTTLYRHPSHGTDDKKRRRHQAYVAAALANAKQTISNLSIGNRYNGLGPVLFSIMKLRGLKGGLTADQISNELWPSAAAVGIKKREFDGAIRRSAKNSDLTTDLVSQSQTPSKYQGRQWRFFKGPNNGKA